MARDVSLECYIVPKIQAIKQIIEDDGVGILGSNPYGMLKSPTRSSLFFMDPNAVF